MDRNEILNRIKVGIAKMDPYAEVYLFGSRARGDNRIDSDWDILILTPRKEISFDYELSLREPILDIELETGQVIALMVYSKSDWRRKRLISPLFSTIQNEGLRL